MHSSPNRRTLLAGLATIAAGAAVTPHPAGARGGVIAFEGRDVVVHSDEAWRSRLTPEQYDVLRKAGTEAPSSSPLLNEHRAGTFSCAGCNLALFDASTKFESGTGWPSFFRPLPNAVATTTDTSLLETRTEVHCRRCSGHLGHVFDDGPKPTGLRYCMNGVAMVFSSHGTQRRG